jgi:hypothetical protein
VQDLLRLHVLLAQVLAEGALRAAKQLHLLA